MNYSHAQQTKVDVIKISKKVEKQDTIIKIKYSDFKNFTKLSDFVKDIPATCDLVAYYIQVVFKDKIIEVPCIENKFSLYAETLIIGGLKPGQKFFIESISTSCVKVKFKSYTVLITQ